MSDRKVAHAVRSTLSFRRPRRSLLVKFLLLLSPIFILAALPGMWFLTDYQLRESENILAARIGNLAARAAAALERQAPNLSSAAAQDLINMLAVDRAILCAELIDKAGGRVLLAQPPNLGCGDRPDGNMLSLSATETPPTKLRLSYSDAELIEAKALQRYVSLSVVTFAFLLAVARILKKRLDPGIQLHCQPAPPLAPRVDPPIDRLRRAPSH